LTACQPISSGSIITAGDEFQGDGDRGTGI
jgi:hypothetical protein